MEQLTLQTEQKAQSRLIASRARLILALIIIASFLDVVDFSIVNIALPAIRINLSVGIAESQWIVGAYGLTLAGFLMLSGRAGDVYGQKRLFLGGIIVFTVSSLTAGFAPNFIILVASRAIQGVGAAMTSATAFAILAETFPEGPQRNRAIGRLVAFLSAGFAAGTLAGGVLTAAFGWRSVMFVNVPIGVVASTLSWRFLPETGGQATSKQLDVPGALSVTSGLMLLVFALTNAATNGFATLETAVPLGLSAIVLSVFVVIEQRSEAPLMPLSFLRRGSVLSANVLALILTAGAGGFIFILTIYLQQVLLYSALTQGLAFLPLVIIFFVGGGWGANWLVNRFGMKRALIGSMTLITLGSALLIPISVAGGYFGVLPGELLWVTGAALSFTALNIAGLAGSKPGEEGLASGLINTSQRIGAPMGLAILLTVVGATDPPPAGGVSQALSMAGLVTGFQYAFLASTIFNAIGLLIALRLKNQMPRWGPIIPS